VKIFIDRKTKDPVGKPPGRDTGGRDLTGEWISQPDVQREYLAVKGNGTTRAVQGLVEGVTVIVRRVPSPTSIVTRRASTSRGNLSPHSTMMTPLSRKSSQPRSRISDASDSR